MIYKSYKYRLYPSKKQEVLIEKHIGACRYVYNLALETKQKVYDWTKVNLSSFDLMKQLTDLKKDCEWLKDVNSQSLNNSIANMDDAYKRFFKKISKFPQYKKKSTSKKSFTIPQHVRIENGKLIIIKFSEGIKLKQHRKFDGVIKQATISKTPTGKYFVSILVETADIKPVKCVIDKNTTVGVDLGLSHFLITSDGDKEENPKYYKKTLKKLKFIQRKYSKHKGKRTKHKLCKLHEKVASQRKDFHYKLSSKLVKKHDSIALETLKVKEMMQNEQLSQSISDVGWSNFVLMLEYKSDWYGKNILRIGTFEPSSKMCSCCSNINKQLTLKDREWLCSSCGTTHDRDINAAINIKNIALKI